MYENIPISIFPVQTTNHKFKYKLSEVDQRCCKIANQSINEIFVCGFLH